MGFYRNWKEKGLTSPDSNEYLEKFLRSEPETLLALKSGDEEELQEAYDVLHATPISAFFHGLKCITDLPPLAPADIPCFSTMENGASRLNELLSFAPEGLTFSQIGYQLMNSVKDGAQKKYGENQSKLAALMSLVELSTTRPVVVKETAWGSFLTRYDYSDKKDVLKKLLLRDPCVQNLICRAFSGPVRYDDVVSFLKHSTKVRRRTNVRYLVTFILKESDHEIALSNIDWDV